MLRSAVLLPSAIQPPPDSFDPIADCLRVIHLLQDMAENGVILVDDHGRILNAIRNAIDSWPAEAELRKLGMELLKKLKITGRFVEVASSTALSASHHLPECAVGFSLTRTYEPEAIISRASCLQDIALSSTATEVVQVDRLLLSAFARRQAASRKFRIDEGAWTTGDFEKQVLEPVFRYATTVKIFDRYVAHSIRRNSDHVEPRFALSLHWITRTLSRATRFKNWRLEIYTSVPAHIADIPARRAGILAAIEALQSDLRAEYNNPLVTFFVKRDEANPHRQMPHARYIITDSCGVVIERGLDLIWTDEQMVEAGLDPTRDPRPLHNTEISLSPSPTDIDPLVRRLRSL